MTGASRESALRAEFRDRLLGQLAFFSTMIACVAGAAGLAWLAALAYATVPAALLPAALWLAVLYFAPSRERP